MTAIISRLSAAVLLCMMLAACSTDDTPDTALDDGIDFTDRGRDVPSFSADSAFAFIEAQLAFGPRNPNSEGHRAASAWFTEKLREYAGRRAVFTQEFEHQGYDEVLDMVNIIASFNPTASDRIMLCAHWDTRPRAEHDDDPDARDTPLMGADDGASGVAVLLELARIMADNPPPIGVDIILFDGEDYGEEGDLANYFLGSRYWSANPPVPGYMPRFGILLDMVGGREALFPLEQYSARYAPAVQQEVWSIADELGFERFLNEPGMYVQDDHMILNEEYGLPTINIIHQSRQPGYGDGTWNFPPWWHTHGDDIEIIDRDVLGEVGEVLLELIYNRL